MSFVWLLALTCLLLNGTAATTSDKFPCKFPPSPFNQQVPFSRVGDSIIDCCDLSDEQDSQPLACANWIEQQSLALSLTLADFSRGLQAHVELVRTTEPSLAYNIATSLRNDLESIIRINPQAQYDPAILPRLIALDSSSRALGVFAEQLHKWNFEPPSPSISAKYAHRNQWLAMLGSHFQLPCFPSTEFHIKKYGERGVEPDEVFRVVLCPMSNITAFAVKAQAFISDSQFFQLPNLAPTTYGWFTGRLNVTKTRNPLLSWAGLPTEGRLISYFANGDWCWHRYWKDGGESIRRTTTVTYSCGSEYRIQSMVDNGACAYEIHAVAPFACRQDLVSRLTLFNDQFTNWANSADPQPKDEL